MRSYEDVVAFFPKVRTELPEEYKKIWDEHYLDSRKGRTKATRASSKMESWLHRRVAESANEEMRTLEIGAGTLNQLEYEKSNIYDIVEPQHMLYKDSEYFAMIRKQYDDINEIPSGSKYDRIISVATFEHICNLPEVVEKCASMLEENGVLAVSIPNEGRFLWHFAYTMTTGREFKKKFGLDYEIWMRYEHVNTSDEIDVILRHYFKNVRMKLLGIGKTLSLYRYYECRGPINV